MRRTPTRPNNLLTTGSRLDVLISPMHPLTSSPTIRRSALVLTAAATILLAGCGAQTTTSSTGAPGGSGSAPASATPGTSPGSTAPATPPGTGAKPAAAGPYSSAITGEVVANPAFKPLGRDITERITKAGLPGASLLVLHDGSLVEQEAFGSYTLDTVVPIASASKWLTGATIMSLVDDGLIDLDKPISTYLPNATGASGRITMRQLVSFTSGLEYDDRIPCVEDINKTLAQCNEEILALPLLAPPGTGYRYTSTHLHVAAGVAEAVTGQTFEQIFQERIAQPLGMTHTSFVNPVRTAKGGAPDGHPNPAGSAVSTLGDYGRFLEMLVHEGVAPDGTRLLSAASIAAMSTDQTGDAKFVSAAAHHKASETPYGVGHWLDVVNPDGSALVESSPGKFGFRPWIDHVNNIAGVYLIVDEDDTHVADSPDRAADAASDVQTSGNFVLIGAAEALGGKVPAKR